MTGRSAALSPAQGKQGCAATALTKMGAKSLGFVVEEDGVGLGLSAFHGDF